MRPPLRSRLIVLALLGTPLLIGGALLLRSAPSPVPEVSIPDTRPAPSLPDGSEELPPPAPAFPSGGPSPEGKVSLQDVAFGNWNPANGLLGPFRRLRGQLQKNDELVLTAPGETAPVWQGPVGSVEFVEETVAGVHTVKTVLPDGEHEIWSDRKTTGSPDLQLLREENGAARLLDKRGTVLWSGALESRIRGSSSRRQGTTYMFRTGGVQIDGVDGMFTVRAEDTNTVLWSGRLPKEPLVLVRNGNRFQMQSSMGSESGMDRVSRVRFEKDAGTVTITDRNEKVLGVRPITILKAFETTDAPSGGPQRFPRPAWLTMPDARLTKKGTIFLTYKDSNGRILRRSKVYKGDGGSGGSMSTG